MDDHEIYRNVLKVISEVLAAPETSLSSNTKIREDLGVDSMQMITLVIALDEEFDAEFAVDEIPLSEVTIGWVCEFVKGALNSSRAG